MKKQIKLFLTVFLFTFLIESVQVQAEELSLNQSKLTVNVGDAYDLDVIGTEKIPVWTSYNENVVKVDKDGVITAKRTGSTTIKARVGFTYKTCSVKVVNSSIKLNKSAATIYTGGTSVNTVQLKATVKGASKTTTWMSEDESIATVDDKGKVTSVGEGTTNIVATANGKSAYCQVTVKNSSISLNMDSMQLSTKGNGSSIKLTPSIVGSKKSVKWTTSDKSVATVSGGKVTGKKEGTATITATANGVSAACEVTVVNGLISINEEKMLLYNGESKTLKTNAGKKDTVNWSSSDTSVATVDNGKVQAVGTGTAVISVESNGKTDTCEVTVKDTVTSIAEDEIKLRTKGTDKTYKLNTSVIGRKSSIKWTTSDKKVATVSGGKITAKKAGTATITATANGVSDSVTVTVEDYIPTIKLNQSNYTLYTVKGNTITLKATVDGLSKTVTWNSSNTNVATVTNKGKVTAVGEGDTIISATANGVTAECIITVRESKVILEKENIHLDKGEKDNIPVDVIGKSQSIKWASTNSKVVNVKNGVVTAKNYGEADIKVTANGVTSICHINVSECTHSFDEGTVTTEPTCTEEGVKTYTCSVCGYSYTESIPTIEHSWREWVTTKEATETEVGEQKHTCTVCGKEETEILPMLEHTHKYDATVTAPTCTEDGYTTYKCKCGDSYTGDTVPATGHSWGEWIVTKEATETEKGEQKHICSVCKAEEVSDIPELSHTHKYEPTVTDPTCTEDGYITYTCSGCGDTYTGDTIPTTGHSWGEWIVTKEATETETGLKKHICSICEAEETETIPVAEHIHKYNESIVTDPTCTKEGYTTYKCACGDNYNSDYVEALGHNYSEEWTIVQEPTCTENGWKEQQCTRCGCAEGGQFITKTGHSYDEGTVTTAATCTADGEKVYTCSSCGDTKTETIGATGHTYGVFEETLAPADFETFGTANMVCPACETTLFSDLTAVLVDLGDGNSETMYGYYDYDEAKTCFDLTYNYLANHENSTIAGWVEKYGYVWNEDKYNYACIRTAEMGYELNKNGDATHKRPNGNSLGCGENLATRITTAKDPQNIEWTSEEVFQAWLDSSGHKDNIEGGYEQMASAKFKCWLPDWECWSICWVQNFY